jgi:hypothetical protein
MKLEFTIGTQTYRVPDFIDVETFERAIVWNLDDLKNLKPFVATIVGCPIYELNRVDEEVLAFITGTCLQKIQLADCEIVQSHADHNLIDPEDFTFGQFIDFDTYISLGAGENLSKITALLYGFKPEEVKHWPVQKVWGALQMTARWRTEVYKEYDEFFELSEKEDVGEVNEPSEANIQLMWWESIMALAGEDFLKIHQVVERPYREALNYLTWKKAQVQKQKLQNLKAKNDVQRRIR